jgi:hypothetical protein
MNDIKNYIINLHAVGEKKITSGYAGRREVCAHFRTPAEVGTIAFEEAKMDAVDHYWKQNKRYWQGYRIGKLEVEVGRKPVDVMSPAWEYHKGRSFPVFEEVK